MENQENNKTENNYKLRFLDDSGNSYPNWEQKSFLELYFRCFSNKKSIQRNSFLKTGEYPIVSQEKNLINGYSDFEDENLINEPVIVFGDHTLSLKLIDFPFYKGADGIVLLKNKTNNENLTFLYQLLKLNLPHSQGYKRHFSVIKNKLLMIPSFAEQQKIGSFLSEIDYYIQLQKEEITLTKEYKNKLLKQIFNQQLKFLDNNGNNYPNWQEGILDDICIAKSSTNSINKLDLNENNQYAVYDTNRIFGKVDFYDQIDDYIAISKDGSIGKLLLCKAKSSIIGTMAYLKPKNNDIDLLFLFYKLETINFNQYKVGSSIPHIYFSDYKKEKLLFPSLVEQKQIGLLLTNLDQQISQLELEFKNLNEYKNILLNKLMF